VAERRYSCGAVQKLREKQNKQRQNTDGDQELGESEAACAVASTAL
jgi:hypothetical protein